MKEKENKQINRWITIIAVVLPLVVAVLYFMPKGDGASDWVRSLPKFNAILNGSTFLVLVAGLIAIKREKKVAHRNLMMSAIVMSAMFLLGYVAYHAQVESTKFLGEGAVRFVYFFILITHIILSAALAPLVLVTFTRALKGNFEGHKKIATITYPIWLYVSLTGIIVYLMISPYY